MRLKNVLPVLLVAAFLLSACGGNTQAAIQTGIAQTLQISQLETAAAGGGAPAPQATTDPGQPAATQAPTDTPTITLTFTPSIPLVSVSTNTNCRRGPSVAFDIVTTINVGQPVEVLKTFSNSYAVVKNPNGSGDCWLFLQYANTTDFSAYALAAATQPPTPTNTATPTPEVVWDGNWNMYANGAAIGVIDVNESGNSLSGSFAYSGSNFTFSLTLNSAKTVATGSYTNTTAVYTRPLVWQIKKNTNQFIGHFENAGTNYEWCGWRSGASMPSPCLLP